MTTTGYTIEVRRETYDGGRRAHTMFFFHVTKDGQFVKSFKRRAQAEKYIERLSR